MTEIELLEQIVLRLDNLTMGFQTLLYIMIAFFVWKIITVIYKLFAGVFFGGV